MPYYIRRYAIRMDENGDERYIPLDPYDDIDEWTDDEYDEDEPEEESMGRGFYRQEDIDFIEEARMRIDEDD